MTTLALAVANASVRRNVPGAGPPVHARAPEISAITKTTETAAYVSVMMLARRSEMKLSIACPESSSSDSGTVNRSASAAIPEAPKLTTARTTPAGTPIERSRPGN